MSTRAKLPDTILELYHLKRVALSDHVMSPKELDKLRYFEYPRLTDVLYKRTDTFAGREIHKVDWNVSGGSIKVPKLTFFGDDMPGAITTPDYF